MRFRSISIAAALAALALPAAARAQALAALDHSASAAIDKVAASVVLLEVERTRTPPRPLTPFEREWFGVGPGQDVMSYFTRPDGPCSGVVVAPGVIATSAWNLEGEGAVTVITPDGARLPGRRLGRDENLDVALVGVDAPGLAPLPAATAAPAVGRFLFLVGRAAPDTPIATDGIVSGLGRARGDSFTHSCRTSFDNAGGALVDLDGRLVGIAVRHTDRARQGQSSGVGFGAPMDLLQPRLAEMAQGKVITRRPGPFLGIQFAPDRRGDDDAGVRIGLILPGEAAEAAGLRAGDVIKVFNNVELLDPLHLREELDKLEIGSTIVITVKRGDQELDVTVTLGARVREE